MANDWVDKFFAHPEVREMQAPFRLGRTPRMISIVQSGFSGTSDLSFIKHFLLSNVHEGANPEWRLEAQNAFNHPL